MSSSPASRRPGPARIRMVVTCSDRKVRPVPDDLRVRRLDPGPIVDRSRAWTARLEHAAVEASPASALYSGDHWSVAKGLAGAASGWEVDLWVASAGYGLVPASASLKPYAATFSPRHPDSVLQRDVGAPGASTAEWWAGLARWPGPCPGTPRSLTDLAASAPSIPLMVVASAAYLTALAPDILTARRALADPQSLVVVSVGASPTSAVRDLLVPADARLQTVLGGARQSLNVRLARAILSNERDGFHLGAVRAAVSDLMATLPAMVRYNRRPQSDDQVLQFILRERRRTPGVSCSQLLRTLRDRGLACEQHRFRGLFRAAREGAA